MKKQGNHMVDLPEEEEDWRCKHDSFVAEDVIDFSIHGVTLEITCVDCGHRGTLTLIGDMNDTVWDEE